MLGAAVYLELGDDPTTEAIVRNHALHRLLHDQLRAATAAGLGSLALVTTDISREAHISLLNFLLAGEADFAGVDHDDEIASINVRGKNGFLFSAEKIGNLDGDTAERLVSGIDEPPATLDVFFLGGK